MIVALSTLLGACSHDWRTASRESAQIAPPANEGQAVIQVYAAAVWGWRGWFADHTWFATKEKNADQYTVLEVIGWRARRGLPVVRIAKDIPDRHWFGQRPRLLLDIRGQRAEHLIPKIHQAAANYPYPDQYAMLGPNSNTFTAWIAQQVSTLNLSLSMRAIGKNFHTHNTPSVVKY